MEEILEELSLRAFVEISNTFSIWWAVPETITWKVKVTHCTYRYWTIELKGPSLKDLLMEALTRIKNAEEALASSAIMVEKI